MPCLKIILNCFALEHSAKKFESVLRLNFSSDNPAVLLFYDYITGLMLMSLAVMTRLSNYILPSLNAT